MVHLLFVYLYTNMYTPHIDIATCFVLAILFSSQIAILKSCIFISYSYFLFFLHNIY